MKDDEFLSQMGSFFGSKPKLESRHEIADEFADHLFSWMRDPKGFREEVEEDRAPGRHASSLWQTCGRRHIIEAIFKPKLIKETYTEAKVITTGLGHCLHELWQREYMGASGLMYGLWECVRCQNTTEGLMPKECPHCGGPWKDCIKHREYFVEIPEMNLCGHCDGILRHPETGKLYVFEFKTKSSSQYNKLKKPTMDHVWQAHVYIEGLRRMGYDIEGAVLVYMDKGRQTRWRKKNGVWYPGKKAHVKRYFVEFDDELWEEAKQVCADEDQVLLDIKNNDLAAADYSIAEANELASRYRRRCDDVRCDLADDCQVAEQCFNLDALEV